MQECKIKNMDELPLMLNAEHLVKLLGISRSKAYQLMNEKNFPTLRIGNKLLTPKDEFLVWVEKQVSKK